MIGWCEAEVYSRNYVKNRLNYKTEWLTKISDRFFFLLLWLSFTKTVINRASIHVRTLTGFEKCWDYYVRFRLWIDVAPVGGRADGSGPSRTFKACDRGTAK